MMEHLVFRDRILLGVSGLGLFAALAAPPASAGCAPPAATGDAAAEIGDNEPGYLFAPSVTLDGRLYGVYAGDANVIATRDDDGALTAGDTGVCLGDHDRFDAGFERRFTAGAIAEIGDHTAFAIRLSGGTATVERGILAGDDATILIEVDGAAPLIVAEGPLVAAGERADITLRGTYRIETGDAVTAGSGAVSGAADVQVTIEGTLAARNGTAIGLGGGDDAVFIRGTVEGTAGAVDLGEGDDRLVLYTGSQTAGGLAGGAGDDRLTLDRLDGDAATGTLEAATGFEALDIAAGRWTLGDVSTFGTVAVASEATLVAPEGFGGAATVAGRLEAAGDLASVTVEASGVLAVHGPAGATLDASGAVVIAGTLEIDLAADGTNDRLAADTIVLDPATARLSITAAAGLYAAQTDYTILTTQQVDGLSGRFAEVSEDYALLDAELSYLDEAVVLTLVRNGTAFADLGRTRNQRAVGAALDAAGAWDVAERLVGMTTAAIPAALDALSGDLFPSALGARVAEARLFDAALRRRVEAAFGAPDGGAVRLAYDRPAPANTAVFDRLLAADRMRRAGWLAGHGGWFSFEGDGNAGAMDDSVGGASGGLDLVSGETMIGLALGYSSGSVEVASRGAEADTDTVLLALYAARQWHGATLSGGASYGWSSTDSRRTALGETYSASYDGGTASLFAEIAYDARLGGSTFTPFAGLSYARAQQGGFVETGGAAALISDGGHFDSLASTLGLRASHEMVLAGGVRLTPHGALAWRHAYGDLVPDTAMHFVETGTGFQIEGLAMAGEALAVGAGVALDVAPGVTLSIDYAGQFGDGAITNTVKASGRIGF